MSKAPPADFQLTPQMFAAGIDAKCDSCGNATFSQVVLIRKISKLITLTHDDVTVPLPTFACNACNHVNVDFIPLPMRNEVKSAVTTGFSSVDTPLPPPKLHLL